MDNNNNNKVLYNNTYGGFAFSDELYEAYFESKGIQVDKITKNSYTYYYTLKGTDTQVKLPASRHDKDLVALVEQFFSLGLDPSGPYSSIDIATIDADRYMIEEYDSKETIIGPKDLAFIIID